MKLRGLCADKYYKCEETGQIYSGALLMKAGLNLNDYDDYDGESYALHFSEVK